MSEASSEQKCPVRTDAWDWTGPQPFLDLVAKNPRAAGIKYEYGTAGFRMNADLLSSVTLRMGVLAAIRSNALRDASTGVCPAVGVMITASHNPVVRTVSISSALSCSSFAHFLPSSLKCLRNFLLLFHT